NLQGWPMNNKDSSVRDDHAICLKMNFQQIVQFLQIEAKLPRRRCSALVPLSFNSHQMGKVTLIAPSRTEEAPFAMPSLSSANSRLIHSRHAIAEGVTGLPVSIRPSFAPQRVAIPGKRLMETGCLQAGMDDLPAMRPLLKRLRVAL
ncbi:MAG: hypothetical protein WCH40_06275, partial [Verrucomicrobiales bacterium]